jgi:hypothetical protein
MSKPLLGVLIGGLLGVLDGLSAWFSPEARPMMMAIVTGSTLKGVVTGLLAGFIAQWRRSTALGVMAGLAIGFALSTGVAMAQGDHYLEIVLPGMLVGGLAGFVTQRYPQHSGAPASGHGDSRGSRRDALPGARVRDADVPAFRPAAESQHVFSPGEEQEGRDARGCRRLQLRLGAQADRLAPVSHGGLRQPVRPRPRVDTWQAGAGERSDREHPVRLARARPTSSPAPISSKRSSSWRRPARHSSSTPALGSRGRGSPDGHSRVARSADNTVASRSG